MTTAPERIGLCLGCAHARRVPSRTTLYWRCALAERDPRFERYPRLPVLECDGFVPAAGGDAGGEPPRKDDGPDGDPPGP